MVMSLQKTKVRAIERGGDRGMMVDVRGMLSYNEEKFPLYGDQ